MQAGCLPFGLATAAASTPFPYESAFARLAPARSALLRSTGVLFGPLRAGLQADELLCPTHDPRCFFSVQLDRLQACAPLNRGLPESSGRPLLAAIAAATGSASAPLHIRMRSPVLRLLLRALSCSSSLLTSYALRATGEVIGI